MPPAKIDRPAAIDRPASGRAKRQRRLRHEQLRSPSRNRSCTSAAVTQRERWQALQAHLSAARACVEAGESHQALIEVEAALALDPDFLAAQSLRDRIRKKSAAPSSFSVPAAASVSAAPAASALGPALIAPPVTAPIE